MTTNRYAVDTRLASSSFLGTAQAVTRIRRGIKFGTVSIKSIVTMTGADRLDTLAGQIYGNSRYWWVLAAASDIGWGLQLPPGTLVYVPDLQEALQA